MMLEPHHAEADVIIGQRICKDGPSETWQRLAVEGRKLIYEIDDDLFRVDPSSPHAYKWYSQKEVKDHIRKNASVASMVTVTTETLAVVMREFNDNVVVIPNYVDQNIFEISVPKNPHLTIGWAGSTSHQMDFDQARGMLKTVARRFPQAHFQFSGADYGRKIFPPDRYTFMPYEMDVWDHYRVMARLNIGIAPLAHHRFNRSKSGLKFVEFAALGIPCVASNVEPYAEIIEHGKTGFLVQYDRDWATHLRSLIQEPELAADIALNAYMAAKSWTIQNNVHKWETAIHSLLAERVLV
jgi:glycosyltransferase involved in cell wall biosynthesis